MVFRKASMQVLCLGRTELNGMLGLYAAGGRPREPLQLSSSSFHHHPTLKNSKTEEKQYVSL